MDIYTHLLRIILPLEIIIGIFGNTMNILIFTRKTLRRNSCTQYFLAGSINNLLVVCFLFIISLISDGYGVTISSYSSIICKLNCYLSYLIYNISPYLLVLASFDRFCCSSSSVVLRSLTQVHIARKIIITMLGIFLAIFIPLLIVYDLIDSDPPQCISTSQTFNANWSIFQLIFYAMAPPILMVIFGLLTLWNIRIQRRLIQPINSNNQSHGRNNRRLYRRSDNELLRMLIFQVFAYVLCATVLCVMMTIINFVPNPTLLMVTLLRISMLPFFLSYCTSFYIYTLSGKLYRQEIMNIINQTRRHFQNIFQ
ncbi:hypothetical protein I4U23_023505 [Adineta vaga]|nr:hypothetical protein I4U23_023505 [Adineta vaga]